MKGKYEDCNQLCSWFTERSQTRGSKQTGFTLSLINPVSRTLSNSAFLLLPIGRQTPLFLDHFQSLQILLALNQCLTSSSKLSGPSLPAQPSRGSETGVEGTPCPPTPTWSSPSAPGSFCFQGGLHGDHHSPSFLGGCSGSRWTSSPWLRTPSERNAHVSPQALPQWST